MVDWSHGEKEVRGALDDAATAGFTVKPTPHAHGHSWGYIDCTAECGGRLYVWSTPQDPMEMARKIRKFMRRHDHKQS